MRAFGAVVAFPILIVLCSLPASGQAPLAQSFKSSDVVAEGDSGRSRSWFNPVASAVVPGSGQLLAGQDRGAIYLVAEVFLWTRFITRSNEGGRERDKYRDLAFDVARAPFSPARRDTTFKYFEVMEVFTESGPFDTDPGPALVPPTNALTYNGSVWRLARETFFHDPNVIPDTTSAEYRRAIDFYKGNAVGPNFRWSWRNAGLEQDLYRQSIQRSDGAYKDATQYLGLILANHLISAVDAFVSYKLSTRSRAVEMQSRVWSQGGYQGGLRGEMRFQIGF